MMRDIAEVKRALADQALRVCEYLLPGGRQHGAEYETGDLGGGQGRSLKVRLTGEKAGLWSDFASDRSGDLVSLWCQVRGIKVIEAVKEACAWMGQEFEFYNAHRKSVQFARPEQKGTFYADQAAVVAYLRGRGLSRDVCDVYKIRASAQGEVIFPSYRDGILLQQKFMALHRDEHGKKIIRVEAKCEPCLFGWQAIPEDTREVTICEGEIDAMSLWMMGHPALSVPFGGGSGAKQAWIEHEWERLIQFETIYLCMDMDEPGQTAAREIADRLGSHRCRIVSLPVKDANDLLLSGMDPDDRFHAAPSMDPEELKSSLHYEAKTTAILLGEDGDHAGQPLPWAKVSDKIRFRPGEVSVWSGVNGHGKSLMLGHVVMHGAKVTGSRACIASLEMRPERTLTRLARQATGLRMPSRGYIAETFRWFSEWLWLFDLVGTAKVNRLIEVFSYAYRRYGITVFVVDSLSKCGIAEDDYNGQKAFVEQLCDFANTHNVHVHLITHIRKQIDENKPTGKMDVKGTGAITDMAFNNLIVWRNKVKEAKQQDGEPQDGKPDAVLTCDKQRNADGWEGKIALWFDRESMQYLEGENSPHYRYVAYSEANQ